jgi:hypothetical protein
MASTQWESVRYFAARISISFFLPEKKNCLKKYRFSLRLAFIASLKALRGISFHYLLHHRQLFFATFDQIY